MATDVGSAKFKAPEVLEGEYSFEADLWSLGVICHVLITGFEPFQGTMRYAAESTRGMVLART